VLVYKLIASLAIAGACLWLAARHVDPGELKTALAGFNVLYLVPAVAISLLIQVFRAWRWKIELSPLAKLPFSLVWQVVAVAYMMINVLPFRLGEPVRPVLLSWKTELSISAIVGNWVFEKMMDTAAIVFFLHVALLVTELPPWATKAAMASLATFILMVGAVVGFWLKGEAFFNATLARMLPEASRAKVLRVLMNTREGLQILPDRRLVALVFVVTLGLWSLPILSTYVFILGFGFPIPFAAALCVFVAISAGSAIPPPPGMFGVFQIASVVALGLFDVARADALAFGILLNATQFLTLIAQGLIALPMVGVGMGEMTREAVARHHAHTEADETR
jgi:uncharacterized protein (TIRG00374 family)